MPRFAAMSAAPQRIEHLRNEMQDLQQADLRDRNSWRFTLAEVPTVELLEDKLAPATFLREISLARVSVGR